MVDRHVIASRFTTAELTGIAVTREDVSAGELDAFGRKAVIAGKDDDLGNL